jgi:hypothetical protein
MKKIIYLVFGIMFLFNSLSVYAGMRDMIILLDWLQERVEQDLDKAQPSSDPTRSSGFGPTMSSLITALWQKAAPIVVSAATWKNFVQRKEIYADFITLDTHALIAKYKRKFIRFNTDEGIKTFATQCKAYISITEFKTLNAVVRNELMGFLLCYLIPFDQNEWIMEQFGPYFYLLIPKIYQEAQRKKNDYPQEQGHFKKRLSDRERILGLKKGKTVPMPLNPIAFSTPTSINFYQELFQVIPQLFVTKADIQDAQGSKEKTEENIARFLHHWYFYLSGHGAPGKGSEPGTIAGLPSDQFMRLLLFFNNRIQTDFLFYSTCFAGGEHLLYPYERAWFYPPLQRGSLVRRALMPETFNYIIIADTLAYATTSAWLPSIPLPFILGSSTIRFSQYFPVFFQSIKEYFYSHVSSKIDLARIINYVHLFLNKKEEFEPKLQLPVIRYPTTEWFSIVDFKNKIFRLSTVFVDTKEAEAQEIIIRNKEVIVVDPQQFLGRRKAIIDRVHSEILVPVRITKDSPQKKLPAIISSAAARASHYFDKIVVPQGGLYEFTHSFFNVASEAYGRTYYIKRLLCKNDLSGDQSKILDSKYGEGLELNDVIVVVNDRNPFNIRDEKKYNAIIFRYQLQNFAVSWPADDTINNEKFLKEGTFPWLNAITETIPKYPFPLSEVKYKNIIEALKQKQIRGPQAKFSVDIRGLQQELRHLADRLSILNKQLKGFNR